ncbi:type IV toxin-antitoxin system AbiEi family antitoxin domain-containing protein [Cellulosimicrobium marinum]|uniref:type IV toxin-antitoxin system AbiEi family antitoxin domain-containing protein n=1 Tax=Cellulosimicrobium marinum TaxID=1638992 RepID=UPI001E353F14|nr:type IV toxin-antitoxin system AbiEi family antitoxin domain-containing protein [Cellulosimicrobium marinum]MCB7136735.1 hypothetical protein [Cellulosimicrobium marinum]
MRTDPLPHALLARASAQGGLVALAQCRDAGLTDKEVAGLVRRGRFARLTRGVYDTVVSPLAARPWDERRRRAAWSGLLAYGDEAVAVGTSALVLHRVQGLPPHLRPEVAVARAANRRDRDGLRLRQFDAGMTTVEIAGRRVASLEWALAQAVPELPRPNGLAVLDSSLYRGLLDGAGLRRAHDAARGRRGIASRHPLFELADARAESPLESFARLDCVDDGVPPDVLQLPVRTAGTEARGDLAWRRRGGRWLVAEIDGREVHDAPDAVYADRARQNLLVATGRVDVLRFTGRDVGRIGRTVRAALAS